MLTDEERNHLLSIADTVASLHAVDVDHRRGHCLAAAERIRAIAAPRVATVGELLATAPVGSIVEFWHGATANQITTRVGGIDRVWLWRYRNPNGEWSPWDYEPPSPDDLAQVGAIVPVDPSTRGPIGEG